MPELVNISVGSLPGTSGLEATTVWPLEAKKSRKILRMSATVNVGVLDMNSPGCLRPCRKTSPLALLKDPTLLKTDALINGQWVAGPQPL
jgi:hypothetical protein